MAKFWIDDSGDWLEAEGDDAHSVAEDYAKLNCEDWSDHFDIRVKDEDDKVTTFSGSWHYKLIVDIWQKGG